MNTISLPKATNFLHLANDLQEPLIIGREKFAQTIVSDILSQSRYIGVINGVSGVGKTETAKVISKHFETNVTLLHDVTYFELKEAQTAEEPWIKLYRKICEAEKPRAFQAFRNSLNKEPIKKILRLVKGFLKDIVQKKAGELSNTSDALNEIINESVADISSDELLKRVGESNYSILINVLEKILSVSKSKHILILDNFESAPETGLTLFKSVLSKIPNNLKILILINPEKIDPDREDFKILRNKLQYEYTDSIYNLSGLTPADIQQWVYRKHNIRLPNKFAIQASEEYDGRPLFLKYWIENSNFKINTFSPAGPRLYGYLDQHFNKLSDKAKDIVRLLATIFPYSLSPDILQSTSGLTSGEFTSAMEILLDGRKFAENYGTKCFRCCHSIMATFIKDKMGETITDQYRYRLNQALSRSGIYNTNPDRLMLAMKADLITNEDGFEGIQYLLDFTENQLLRGESIYARVQLKKLAFLLKSQPSADKYERAKYYYLESELAKETGNYQESLKNIEKAFQLEPPKTLSIKLFLVQGEVYYRLNKYSSAKSSLKNARKLSILLRNYSHLAKGVIRTASVAMDCCKLNHAFKIGVILEQKILPNVTDNVTISHILRSLARIQAPQCVKKSQINAVEAVRIAKTINSDRVLGNCLYALGDSLRHQEKYKEAVLTYEKALQKAAITGNKDLEIYSMLGIIVSKASINDKLAFTNYLKKLNIAINYEAPVEKLYLRLFNTLEKIVDLRSIDNNELADLRLKFTLYQRKWAIFLIDELRKKPSIISLSDLFLKPNKIIL